MTLVDPGGLTRALVMQLVLLSACATVHPPQPLLVATPQSHELFLLATRNPPGQTVVLERTRNPDQVHVWYWDVNARTQSPGPTLNDAELRALLQATDAATLLAACATLPLLATLERQGYALVDITNEAALKNDVAALTLRDNQLWIADGEVALSLTAFSRMPAKITTWFVSRDHALVAVAASYDSIPKAQDLRVIELSPARAQLAILHGLKHHHAGEFEAALQWWGRAAALDPRAAEVAYNQACTHARLGHPQTALAYLAQAITSGGGRFRALARADVDLDSLREHPAYLELVDGLRLPKHASGD